MMYTSVPFCNLGLREFVDNIFDSYNIPDDIRDLCYEKGKLVPCKACLNKREYKKLRKDVAPFFKYIK